jgi:G3E family GTPase
MPGNVFRGKGILWMDGSEKHYVFHLVGGRFTLDESRACEPRRNRLVLIGQNIDGEGLRARLAGRLAVPVIPAPG